MPFATGFVLLATEYTSGEKRGEVVRHLEMLGFEVYDVGDPYRIVFYVEAPDVAKLEELIRAAESHPGVAKAYIVYGFLGSEEDRRRINEAILRGELQLDEETLKLIDWILERLGGREG